jgi:hypothetical protein
MKPLKKKAEKRAQVQPMASCLHLGLEDKVEPAKNLFMRSEKILVLQRNLKVI